MQLACGMTTCFQSKRREVVACCLLIAVVVLVLVPPPVFSQSTSSYSLNQHDVVQILDKTVDWYQNRAVEQQMATTPEDILFANNDRPVADQILRLSFDFARASTQIVGNNPAAAANSSSSVDSRHQALAQAASKLDDQSRRTQSELEELRKKLETVPPRQRKAVESEIAAMQSRLRLLQARQSVLSNVLQFMGGAAEPGGLASEIEALERSVPIEIAGDSQPASNASNKEGVAALSIISAQHPEPSGIWGILRDLFTLSGKLQTINKNIRQTDELAQSVKQIQVPLRDQLKELAGRSDAVMNQPDSQDPTVLGQEKSTLDALTAQYKVITAAALPLSKEAILLEVYKKNLANWHAATKSQYSANIKNLLVRLLALGALLGIVLAVFALWRRAILRYVQDVRRRYQFLLLRRIALWFVIALIIAFALMSELGSLATFAGLLTAGVAVALQNVILAMVGYFLLIGKFGVRVGDRVQVSGVSGEVVEIGLMRLHVMELAGAGADAQPTGRVVAFSNSIVFQPTASLFKQVPGTSFVWHEITLTLAADSDYHLVERRLRAAVDAALGDYREDFERQRRQLERNLSFVSVGSLAPGVRFRLTPAGLEVLLRFPVDSGKAAEIDDRVTRELLRAIDQEPRLKVVAAEVPAIRLKTEAADRGAA